MNDEHERAEEKYQEYEYEDALTETSYVDW